MASRTVLEELVSVLGYEYKDDGSVDKFSKAGKKTLGIAKSVAAGLAAIATTGAIALLSTMTATEEKQAAAVGMASNAFREWAGIAKEAGFEAEHVTDLVEEMNNKIGEAKGLSDVITPVKESLQILNIQFEDLKKLKPEEQFKMLADAIVNLEDKQAAISAADILMGGEANKFFALLRARGQSVDEALAQQREMILITEEESKATKNWAAEIGRFKRVLVSAGQAIVGMFAQTGFSLETIRKGFADWFRENREGIKAIITGVASLVKMFLPLIDVVMAITEELGPIVPLILVIIKVFKLLTVVVGIFQGVTMAAFGPAIIAALALAAAIALVHKNWETIKGIFGFKKKNVPGEDESIPGTVGARGKVGSNLIANKSVSVSPQLVKQNQITQTNNIEVKTENPMAAGLSIERIIKGREDQAALNSGAASF